MTHAHYREIKHVVILLIRQKYAKTCKFKFLFSWHLRTKRLNEDLNGQLHHIIMQMNN